MKHQNEQDRSWGLGPGDMNSVLIQSARWSLFLRWLDSGNRLLTAERERWGGYKSQGPFASLPVILESLLKMLGLGNPLSLLSACIVRVITGMLVKVCRPRRLRLTHL